MGNSVCVDSPAHSTAIHCVLRCAEEPAEVCVDVSPLVETDVYVPASVYACVSIYHISAFQAGLKTMYGEHGSGVSCIYWTGLPNSSV
jgi:hypothetical protein